jgi:hypoxanthine-DNA glycosylase
MLACLPPVADARAEILVLGTMPGPLSLARQQYYAHPRNAFWPIVGALFGFDAGAPYAERLAALRGNRIALWDVLASCRRQGAADSAIRDEQANDFEVFFASHRRLRHICFNGGTAAELFRQQVSGTLALPLVLLPSTSPAYAAMTFAEKCRRWEAGLRG